MSLILFLCSFCKIWVKWCWKISVMMAQHISILLKLKIDEEEDGGWRFHWVLEIQVCVWCWSELFMEFVHCNEILNLFECLMNIWCCFSLFLMNTLSFNEWTYCWKFSIGINSDNGMTYFWSFYIRPRWPNSVLFG